MCLPASMIVTKNDVLFDPIYDSHEKIIEKNKLNDKVPFPDFVRVEIVPEGCKRNYSLPFSEWKYKVDQDFLPDWYNTTWAEKQCRGTLPEWAKTRFVTEGDHTCTDDQTLIVLSGSPRITQSGGCIFTYGSSTPEIQQLNGAIEIYDSSSPVINQSDGFIYTHGLSTPVIEQSSGSICTYDSSAPKITQLNGVIYTYELSAPVIQQSNMYALNTPVVEQSNGSICTYDSSAPQIKQLSGKIKIYKSSTPVIQLNESYYAYESMYMHTWL